MKKNELKELEKKDYINALANIFHEKLYILMRDVCNKDVYNAMGIQQSNFSTMINEKKLPTVEQIHKLAKYFNVTMDYFFDEEIDENGHKPINWKNLTNKEVMEILIDMISAHQINVSTNIIDNHVIDGMVGYSANISFTDGYLPAKLHEWIELTKPIRENKHEYNEKILEVMKEGFLNSVNDEPFYDLPF